MAGSQITHELSAITFKEITAWSEVTGRKPNLFEINAITHMDHAYVAAINNGKQRSRSGQAVGEYCRNKSVEKCRQQFGGVLEQICSTCPS
jgi:hypothetical protein